MIDTAACTEPFVQTLQRFAEAFDVRFSNFLQTAKPVSATLAEAMRYSALAPGKRFRPFLVTECCRLAGGSPEDAAPAAMAIECVHAFSLVHDDLPAMDDQDLRRGRPTNHVRFGEAMAILAGDALLSLAFEWLASEIPQAERAVALVRELAGATGWNGMIAGQVADLEGEALPPNRERVQFIHERKTACLIRGACRMGVLAAGGGGHLLRDASEYGWRLGLAFQIVDDLLDATASIEKMGKPVGQDQAAGKQTYPASVGVEGSRIAARSAADRAIGALDRYGNEALALRELARFVVERAF